MSAFPPQRSTPSIPISQALALSHLQAYLESAQSLPYLLPNARLEPTGPTAGSSASSITIFNLQRVEAGLRGEWLAPVLELNEEPIEVAVGMDDGVGQEGGDEMGVEGWQDPEEYAREQSIEEGDVEPETTAIAQEGEVEPENTAVSQEGEEGPVKQLAPVKKRKLVEEQQNTAAARNLDTKARKEAKKQKRNELKLEKEKERKKAAAAAAAAAAAI